MTKEELKPILGGVILDPKPHDDSRLRGQVREALDAMLALWSEFASTGKPPDTATRAYVARLIGNLGECSLLRSGDGDATD